MEKFGQRLAIKEEYSDFHCQKNRRRSFNFLGINFLKPIKFSIIINENLFENIAYSFCY